VVLQGKNLVHYWRSNLDRRLVWQRGDVITRSATGPGCIIESTSADGSSRNLEVVVQEGSQLVHYTKKLNGSWEQVQTFGSNVNSGPSFIQSRPQANFELVVREGSNLVHYTRDNSGHGKGWERSKTIATTATGGGSISQNNIAFGNLEVLFQEGDHVAHYSRDNSTLEWTLQSTFGSNVTGPPSLIQMTFGTPGDGSLVAVVRQGNDLVRWFKYASGGDLQWRDHGIIVGGVNSSASFIQSTIREPAYPFGRFDLVVLMDTAVAPPDSRVEGGWTDYELVHWFLHPSDSYVVPWTRAQNITYRGRSERICQLTGDVDVQTGALTRNNTAGKFNLGKTDLGYPVDDGQEIALYFGDSRDRRGIGATSERGRDDAVGFSYQRAVPSPTDCLAIDHVPTYVDPLGELRFLPLEVLALPAPPIFSQGLFNVPQSGFAVGSTKYTIFWTNHCAFPDRPYCPVYGLPFNKWGRAVVTRNTSPWTFQELFTFPEVLTYTAAINSERILDIPAGQRLGVYVWGVTRYRKSYPTLAHVPSGQVERLDRWLYFKGVDDGGVPQWSRNPDFARPMFKTGDDSSGCIGEFSVSWEAPLQRWLMLYNCNNTVRARFALAPWGPWSEPTDIFEPRRDGALCRYMHAFDETCIDTIGVDNPDSGHDVPGLPYAPYVLSRFTRPTPEGAEIYFLMSTWNPYQVVVMRANLTISAREDEFFVVARHSGKCLHQHGGTHGDGDSITQYTCVDQPNVKIRRINAGTGTSFLQFVHSGKCVHLEGASSNEDAKITQWSCIGQPNVEWRMEPASGDDTYYLVSEASGKCIHQLGATKENGDQITQRSCSDQSNFQWKLVPAP
jgi:hypothetical protein